MDSNNIAILKAVIADLQGLLYRLENPRGGVKPLEDINRHSHESFLAHGKIVSDKDGWAMGCKFPRKTWPLKADGTEYAKLQDLAAALDCECEKGTKGPEIYLCFGSDEESVC